MREDSSATNTSAVLLPRGLAWGGVGVVAFSLTLPTTQVATRELGPVFATAGRAVAAALLALAYLAYRRARLPYGAAVPGLVVVAAGVVVGFPLFTSLALQRTDSAHGAVLVGLLPAATAVMGVLRNGERPAPAFWVACAAGAASVAAFAVVRGAGLPTTDDGLTLLAVLCAAVGYAEGTRLAPQLGSDQVICWALLVSLPLLLPFLVVDVLRSTPSASAAGWSCFAYTAVVSMFLGFFAWYRGLSLGGVAKVSQVQLAQPLLTVGASVVLFGQHLDAAVVVTAVVVLACVAAAQRTRVARPPLPAALGRPAVRRPPPAAARPVASAPEQAGAPRP